MRLRLAPGLAKRVAKGLVVGERLELAQSAEIDHPAVADRLCDGCGERRVRQQQPTTRGDAVGLVVEPLRKHVGQVFDRHRAQQPGVNRRHSIGAVRADDGQIGHPDFALGAFLDEAHAPHALLVARKPHSDRIEEAAIDLEDDLRAAWRQYLEPGERPFFERFGQQCVIGVGQSPLCDVPGLVPPQMSVVEQDPHQLRDRHRRMRIVHLDRDPFRQRAPVGIGAAEPPHEVGKRAGDEKIFLHEAQCLPHARRVVGIEHPRKRLGRERSGQSADKIAATELLEIEIVRRGGRPQTQRVDRLAAVTDHRSIKWDADQRRGTSRDGPQPSFAQLHRTVDLHFHPLVRPRRLPRVLAAQPIVRLFVLPAIDGRLFEHAVFVAQPVAHRRQLHRRHRVEKACGQAAESAVSKAGIGFLFEQAQHVELFLGAQFFCKRVEKKIRDVVG